jgi:hypothetical protein
MIETYGTDKDSFVVVFWQEPKGDVIVPEPAIVLKTYSDCLCLQQGKDRSISISLHCVPDLIRAIKAAMKDTEK